MKYALGTLGIVLGLSLFADFGTSADEREKEGPKTISVEKERHSEKRACRLPPVQLVKKSEMELRFTVATREPSNVGRVDVYVTLDDGKTWKLLRELKEEQVSWLPQEEDRKSESVAGSIKLLLREEGVIYGFTVVALNKAGRGKAGPKMSDLPDARVELDETAPVARLFRPQPHPHRQDTVRLSWDAVDRNLRDTPISLSWSRQKEGPWKFIGPEWMANTGSYDWKVPDKLPAEIYLRMMVRDKAGNRAVAQTSKPTPIDFRELKTTVLADPRAEDKPDKKREKKVDTRIFELRTYTAAPGKLDALNARFRDHTNKLFEKHGMTIIGFWMPMKQKEGEEKLIYILAYPSKEAADKSWKAFREDAEWKKVVAETEKNGRLLSKPPESVYMNPTDYSPLK